jgi:transposase
MSQQPTITESSVKVYTVPTDAPEADGTFAWNSTTMVLVQLNAGDLQGVGYTDLQALRGIAHISAVTIAAELGQVSRFPGARELMGYCGAVPSENSSGKRTRRGSITKTGNAHLRRIVVEAAWSYQRPPAIWAGLRKRQQSASEGANEIAWKAQHRLHKRYVRLAAAGKDKRKIVTTVGRELLGFIWAIGTKAKPLLCSE